MVNQPVEGNLLSGPRRTCLAFCCDRSLRGRDLDVHLTSKRCRNSLRGPVAVLSIL